MKTTLKDISGKDFDCIEKLYFNINEVSKILELSVTSLRDLEKKFEVIVYRNRQGRRSFDRNNIYQFRYIKYLLYTEGFTIKGAIKKYKGNDSELWRRFLNHMSNQGENRTHIL